MEIIRRIEVVSQTGEKNTDDGRKFYKTTGLTSQFKEILEKDLEELGVIDKKPLINRAMYLNAKTRYQEML